jgi:hypothetical protein
MTKHADDKSSKRQSEPEKAAVTTDAASELRARQTGTRLQENSAGGSGDHMGRKAGESFAWNPADKSKPNPQRPVGKD